MRTVLLAVLGLGAALTGAARADEAPAPLRLCADPANMPFSSSTDADTAAGRPGLYVEIGQAIAKALGRKLDPVWSLSYFGKRNLRTTLLAGQCDFAVGLPAVADFMGPTVIFTRPILSVGYALAVRKDASIATLHDLDGKRVAVQFSSPPQSLVATEDAVTPSTVMDPEEGMQLLADGKVDAAFVWGPSAGYINHVLLDDTFRIVSVGDPQMRFDAAIGFSRKNAELRDRIDALLPAIADQIEALSQKYGLPAGTVVHLTSVDSPRAGPAVTETAGKTGDKAEMTGGVQMASAAMTQRPVDVTQEAKAAAGHSLFNGTCGHCHGPDAIQSERRINLRLLKHRYGDSMPDVFRTTVTMGRPAKGMPAWASVFSDDDFAKIYAYLSTIQDP